MELCYHGIDFHSSGNFVVYEIRKTADGSIKRKWFRHRLEAYEETFIKKLSKNDYVSIEAGCGTFTFVEKIRPYVKQVIVINPIDFKALYLLGRKNDKIDARKLAEVLKYYIECEEIELNFPEVYVPEKNIQKLRSIFSTYTLLKKQTTGVKNNMRAIIRNNLVVMNTSDIVKYLRKNIENLELENLDKIQLRSLLKIIETYEEEIAVLKAKIIELSKEYYQKELEILMSIDGISIFTACAIIADIGTIERFQKAKQLCSYLRSAPRLDASNDRIHIGKINKRGRKRSFMMIIQGLQHIIKRNDNFQNFYDRKIKGKSRCKVRSALVRKTIVAIFYMLKNKELWEFRNKKNYAKKLKELEKVKRLA